MKPCAIVAHGFVLHKHHTIYIMKKFILVIAVATLFASCAEEKKGGRGRINYDLIKEKAGITAATAQEFDKITADFGEQMRTLNEKNKANNVKMTDEERAAFFAQQDAKIKGILTAEQYAIYDAEIKIERKGREQHNLGLIKEELALDSATAEMFDKTQAVFYKAMRDNHDYYHGKPDVRQQFYNELDVSRKAALKENLTEEQYNKYLQLAAQYKLGTNGGR
jgi:hypothetical protein